jgi:hypothetical protein
MALSIMRTTVPGINGYGYVQVCIDDLPKSFSNSEGGTALPWLGVYCPEQCSAIVLDTPHLTCQAPACSE